MVVLQLGLFIVEAEVDTQYYETSEHFNAQLYMIIQDSKHRGVHTM